MSLRDRFTRRSSQDMLGQIRPAQIRPQSAMEVYVGLQKETLDSPRAQRLMDKAIRIETRYEKRKRK